MLNEIEVLDLKTGTMGSPIPVGPQPQGIDLSPDGRTLYVADSGANQVSVVDVASRRETHRIAVPAGPQSNDAPFSIAVASNGVALLSTMVMASHGDGRMLEINLSTEAVRVRSDFHFDGSTFGDTELMPSGDHTHVGVVVGGVSSGPVWMYDAGTDSFSAERDLEDHVYELAMDRTGSQMLVGPGGYLLDFPFLLGPIPSGGLGMAMAASGTTAYRVQDGVVEVLDLPRLRVAATIPLPEKVGLASGMIALSPDGTALAVLTATGISIVAVADAQPVTTCAPAATATSPAFGVLPLCGAPLASIVIDGAGTAFASNPSRNEVDVVSVHSGALESTIAVGSKPNGLDLSPDGSTLYVADSGGSQVSVVDVATRRETRRINIPPLPISGNDMAFSIAVATNGRALLTTTFNGTGGGGRMLEIDLKTDAVWQRSDFGVRGTTTESTELTSSGDHSHIGVVMGGDSAGPVWVYDAATDSFGPERDLAGYVYDIAVDRTGSRVLVDPNAYVLDGAAVLGRIPADDGRGVVIAASGTTAYRVQDDQGPGPLGWGHTHIDVLDLARLQVVATIALPENRGTASGRIALSPDGTTMAALTATGISMVAVASARPVAACANTATPTSPVFGVLTLCGAPLWSVVIDGTGHAFASNWSRNEIDVVNVHTGALEGTIAVGSEPKGLDLSPDGATLYVADGGGNQVSVVDVASRRETGRINIPPPEGGADTPFAIAVADNGKALLSTARAGTGGRLLEITLSTGAVRSRPDFDNGRVATEDTVVASSGDHSHIGIVLSDLSSGPVFMYTAATDSFGTERDLGFQNTIALDHGGSRVVVSPGDPGTAVLDGNLNVLGTFAGFGWTVSVAPSGIAYRLQADSVDVIDLAHLVVQRTIPLPEPASGFPGAMAVSADGTTLAVLTVSGMSLVTTIAAAPATFTNPVDGQTNIDTTKPFTWNTVAGAQGYYLAVGSTLNGTDLVNSGVLPARQSAFNVPRLPSGKTLYATLLTEFYGTWALSQSITFTAAVAPATFTNPLDGQTNIDTTKPFTWSTVAGAQGYYLAVGSTLNGTDLVNSGVLPARQSAFNVPDLPEGKTLYATLLTEVNGGWSRHQAVTFTAAAGHATFTNPVNGQTSVNNAQPFTWTTVPGAQAYVVAIGTTSYSADLVNSGILPASQSSYTVPVLPKGKVLYATLLTEVGGSFSRHQTIGFIVN